MGSEHNNQNHYLPERVSSHFDLCNAIKLTFLTRPKSAILGVLSALVKDFRQFRQREKRLLKVVTVKLPLYTNNYNTRNLYFVVRRLSNVGEAVPHKMTGKSAAVRKGENFV